MTEGNEVRASHEEVEGFVMKLKEFHGSLDESGQAMLTTILEGAQQGDTGGYGKGTPRFEGPEGREDLIGRNQEQGGEGTQGITFGSGR